MSRSSLPRSAGEARTPAGILAAAWGAAPERDFGGCGDRPLSVASWRLAAAHRITVPSLGHDLICVALSAARRHALWIDGSDHGAGYAPPGSVRIMPAGARADIEVDGLASPDGHFAFLQFYANPNVFEHLGLNGRPALRRPGAGEVDPWLLAIASRLAGIDGEDPPDETEAGHLAMSALARVSAKYTERPNACDRAGYVKGGLAGWQIKRALEALNADLSRSPSVAELAALCQLSPFHFSRAFRQSLGRPPHTYLIERRLEAAARLLIETRQPVTEIALALGYAETGHLSRAFRRMHGVGPAEFRRRR